jgi:hypothetical protein
MALTEHATRIEPTIHAAPCERNSARTATHVGVSLAGFLPTDQTYEVSFLGALGNAGSTGPHPILSRDRIQFDMPHNGREGVEYLVLKVFGRDGRLCGFTSTSVRIGWPA